MKPRLPHRLFHLVFGFTLLLPAALPVAAQPVPPEPSEPVLIADLNQHTSASSQINGYWPVGDQAYFFTQSSATQTGLWRSDGTPAGTLFLHTLSPCPAAPDTTDAAWFGGYLFIGAYEPSRSPAVGCELYRTDGTPEGTVLVADLVPDWPGSDPTSSQVLGDALYFLADDHLWRLDDPAGVPQIIAGPTIPPAQVTIGSDLWAAGNHLYFSGSDPEHGQELWVSDGTSAGTTYLIDLDPGPGSSNAEPRAVTADTLYFVANNGLAGFGLWRYDLHMGSLHAIAGASASSASALPQVQPMGQGVFLTSCPAAQDCALFYAASETAQRLVTLPPGQFPRSLVLIGSLQTPAGERVLFTAPASPRGYELWITDGTPAGSQVLLSSPDETQYGFPYPFGPPAMIAHNRLYFSIADPEVGTELWQSDGTAAGTQLLRDIWPGLRSSAPAFLGPCGSWFCFTAQDGEHGRELWRTDGTTAQLAADLNRDPPGADPHALTPFAGQLYFVADDWTHGAALWRTDGTWSGTQPVWAHPDTPDAAPAQLTVAGAQLYFSLRDREAGNELWVTAGTAASTHRVADLTPGPESTQLDHLVAQGDQLFFTTGDYSTGLSLWRTDGSAAGTVKLHDISRRFNNGAAGILFPLPDAIIFIDFSPDVVQPQLWTTDGTPAGTHPFATLDSNPQILFPAGDRVYWTANQRIPWQTDGTPGGTRPLPAPDCLGSFHDLSHPIRLGNRVIWWDAPPAGPAAVLLATQGETLTCVTTLPPEMSADLHPIYPATARDYAFARWTGSDRRTHLLVTDGTAAGTRPLPGDPRWADGFYQAGPFVFFTNVTQDLGNELWEWSGSDLAAHPLADLAPGPQSADPAGLQAWQGRLYVTASDTAAPGTGHGRELWAVKLPRQTLWLPVVFSR